MPPSIQQQQHLLQLTRRAQWRIFGLQACRLAARPACQHNSLATIHERFNAFSTSPKPLQEQRPQGASTTSPSQLESTTTTPPPPPPSPPPEPSQPTPPKPSRRTRRIISTTLFLALGYLTGAAVRELIHPSAPPHPTSEEDARTTADIARRAAALPLVRQLASDPAWTSWPAYSGLPAASLPRRMTSGPLSGSRGVGGYQRVFRNARTGELVGVVFLGGATVGWPGVVHGGCIATMLDESAGRCAARHLPGGSGVTASLDLRYLVPTQSNDFYVVRTRVVGDDELEERERGKRDRKVWVLSSLENMRGQVCVESRALFVRPKGNLGLAKISEGF